MLDSSKLKEFPDDNSKLDRNGTKFSIRVETLWEKEKLLVTSNFSFSRCVFKRLVLQTRKNQGLFGKGLIVTFQLSSAYSLNLGQSQDGVLGNGLHAYENLN